MSELSWVKLHTDILGDPKLMRAARTGAKGLELLPWLIAFAAKAGDDGRLTVNGEPADAIDIADMIPGAPRSKVAAVAACIESCLDIGVLVDDDGAPRFAAWGKRALGKPSDAPEQIRERVKKHRDRRRAAKDETPTDGDTPNVRNALPVTPSNATEKKREEGEERKSESEKKTATPAGNAPAPTPAAAAPRVSDFSVEHHNLTYADLPPDAIAFVQRFYPAVGTDPKRRRDIADQLLATLNGGARLRRGVTVQAKSKARLGAKCREVITEGVRTADGAIVVLLKKLGDVSDLGPNSEGPGAQLQADGERERARDVADTDAAIASWRQAHSEQAQSIEADVLTEYRVSRLEELSELPRIMCTQQLRTEFVKAMRESTAHARSA